MVLQLRVRSALAEDLGFSSQHLQMVQPSVAPVLGIQQISLLSKGTKPVHGHIHADILDL